MTCVASQIRRVYHNGTMANEMRPPPYPPRPSDVETLPGLDQGERIGRLLIENRRLQRERDEAISLIPDELPPPTRKQVMVGATVGLVKWLGVASLLLTAAAEVASIIKPEYVGPLQSLRKLFEGLAG